jgi:hypothetical protein
MTSTPTPVAPGGLDALTRDELAVLLREWLLHGHLQDRVAVPLLYERGLDREEAEQVAIDEWMAASPIYSLRTQELLGFREPTVATILKNIQIDIGAPPQYMDFRVRVDDDEHGEFWLDHCGALMDVEPMGDEWVHGMCHTIEDPTFDATALATSPHALVRPVHRPPRVPAGRTPHCHWTVSIDPAHPTPEPHPNQALLEGSRAAAAPVVPPVTPDGSDGLRDYAGPLDADLRFEDFSREVLLAILPEVARQSHLLFRGHLMSVAQRVSPEAASENGPRVLAGVAPVTAGRIAAALGITGTDAASLARVLAVHPSFQPPEYVDVRVDVVDDRTVRLAFGPSDVFEEGDDHTWLAGLGGAGDRAIDALARVLDARGSARAVAVRGDERFAYELTVDPDAEPRLEEPETALARFSTAANFQFR